MKRDGKHDAPGQDRHEGPEQDKCPIDQEREQSEPDHELDDVISGQILAKRFQGGPSSES
jgi:hypothetical protein